VFNLCHGSRYVHLIHHPKKNGISYEKPYLVQYFFDLCNYRCTFAYYQSGNGTGQMREFLFYFLVVFFTTFFAIMIYKEFTGPEPQMRFDNINPEYMEYLADKTTRVERH